MSAIRGSERYAVGRNDQPARTAWQPARERSSGRSAGPRPKARGKSASGQHPPDAQLGQGNNPGADYSTPIRNAWVALMNGPAIEIAALDSRIAMQLEAEARQKIKPLTGKSPRDQEACRSRRTRAESRKNPSPSVNGTAPNDAATQASGSTRAIIAKVVM